MNGWWFIAGFVLAYVMGAVSSRIDRVRGRTQVVRFFLLRCDGLLGAPACAAILSIVDELTERGTQNVFRGHVKDLPNSDNPEWKP